MTHYESWGRYPKADQEVQVLEWRTDSLPDNRKGRKLLPFGLGRSYGDSCLNDGGVLIDTHRLNHLIEFNSQKGILKCESGVTLDQILDLVTPHGWFLPVVPGTKHVTVGGAIANDIHGKNHHRAGTFGCHVARFELLRSDGQRLICSADENSDWFEATIGGIGLTGLIVWAEIALKKIDAGPWMASETIRFEGLKEFFELSNASDQSFEYTVSWIDCLAEGNALGRGIFIRGNHEPQQVMKQLPHKHAVQVPFDAPSALLNSKTIKLFNEFYYSKQKEKVSKHTEPYDKFFFPLDAMGQWNRLYGKRGFLQYQCVVPYGNHEDTIRVLLEKISKSKRASFLAVLKIFGDQKSPGMMSFPKPGVTLALDFPNQGKPLFELLDQLDDTVRENGGSVYPAKDARMSQENFKAYFPEWKQFESFIDPHFSSSFWRRVTGA